MKNTYKFKCEICGNPMTKAGKTSIGKQRYKCNICNTRKLLKKENLSKQNELKSFVNWLIDSTKVNHRINTSRSTFYRKTNWCWSVIPKINSDGIPSEFIFVDAIYLNKNDCLLIVRNDKYVLNYRWAEKEDTENYYELLKVIDEPRFVICDGHSSITKAVTKLWKNAGIQRCIIHVVHIAERKLGKRSPSEVNHIFRHHIGRLSKTNTFRKAENWKKKFYRLCEEHEDYINEYSRYFDMETGELITRGRAHPKLRSVCNEIKKLLRMNRLFLFIEHRIPNNSNCLEGGINSPLKNLMRCHRGLVLEHQKRMWEWYLLSRSPTPINEYIKTDCSRYLYPQNDN